MSSRYVVTELEGYESLSAKAVGSSFMVVDSLWNRRVIETWRSEDYGGSTPARRVRARTAAEAFCSLLNQGKPVEPENDARRRRGCGHPHTVSNTYYKPSGQGECLTCWNARFVTANHGTAARYNGGCRCDECKAARSRANHRSYLRRKARMWRE